MGVWVWSEAPNRWAILLIVQQKSATLTQFRLNFKPLFEVFRKPFERTKLQRF